MTEETLVRQAQAGNESAVSELVERHASTLYRYLCRRTGNSADAEDLVQQTFIKAYRAIGRFDARRPLAPWLFSIARNLAASLYRRRRPVIQDDRRVDEQSPAKTLEETDAGRKLWEWARNELPDTQFAVLWLRVEEDLDMAGIARRMKKKESNVKVLLHRARKRLARAYEKNGDPVACVGSVMEA